MNVLAATRVQGSEEQHRLGAAEALAEAGRGDLPAGQRFDDEEEDADDADFIPEEHNLGPHAGSRGRGRGRGRGVGRGAGKDTDWEPAGARGRGRARGRGKAATAGGGNGGRAGSNGGRGKGAKRTSADGSADGADGGGECRGPPASAAAAGGRARGAKRTSADGAVRDQGRGSGGGGAGAGVNTGGGDDGVEDIPLAKRARRGSRDPSPAPRGGSGPSPPPTAPTVPPAAPPAAVPPTQDAASAIVGAAKAAAHDTSAPKELLGGSGSEGAAAVAGKGQGSGVPLLEGGLKASSVAPESNGGRSPPAVTIVPALDQAVESTKQGMDGAGEQQLSPPGPSGEPEGPAAAAAAGVPVGGTDARAEEAGQGGGPQEGGEPQSGQLQGPVADMQEQQQQQLQPQQQDGIRDRVGSKRVADSWDAAEGEAVAGMGTNNDTPGDLVDRPAKRHKGRQVQGVGVAGGKAAVGGPVRGAGAAGAVEPAEGAATTVEGRNRRGRGTSDDGGTADEQNAEERQGQDTHPQAVLPQPQQQQETALAASDGGEGPDEAVLPGGGSVGNDGATSEAVAKVPLAAAPASAVSPVRVEEPAIATTTAGAAAKTPKPPKAPKGRKGGKGPAAQAQPGEQAGPATGASPADPDAQPCSPTAPKPPHPDLDTQNQQPQAAMPPPAPATTGKRRRGAAVPHIAVPHNGDGDGDGAAAVSPRYQQASPSAAADAPPPPAPPSSVTRRTSSRRAPDAAAAASPPPPSHSPTAAPTGQVVVSISRNFSERDRKQFAAMVAQLKGLVADEARADHGEFTHLLMPSNNFKPSMKVLAALASGRPLLDASWLRACADAGRWLPPAEQHAATDNKEERAKKFSVWGAHVAHREHGPFLQGGWMEWGALRRWPVHA